MSWSASVRCFVALALALHAAALGPLLYSHTSIVQRQETQLVVTAHLQLAGVDPDGFLKMSYGRDVESAVTDLLHPAAASITKVANINSNDGRSSVLLELKIVPLQPDIDVDHQAFADTVQALLNNIDYAYILKAPHIQLSHDVEVQLQQQTSANSLADKAHQSLNSLIPDALSATLYSRSSSTDDSYEDNFAAGFSEETFIDYWDADEREQQMFAAYEHDDDAFGDLTEQLPEDATLFGTTVFDSTGSAAAAASATAESQLDGDLILMSRFPVGLPLQQSVLQSVLAMAADLTANIWQTVQQVQGFAGAAVTLQNLQQQKYSSPFNLQEFEITIQDASGSVTSSSKTGSPGMSPASSVGSSSSDLSQQQQQQQTMTPQRSADMEISLEVESWRPQSLWSLFASRQSKKDAAAVDSQQAAEIAEVLLDAIGNGPQDGQQVMTDEQIKQMVMELQTTGSFSGVYETNQQDLQATAAAAVAAAASAIKKDADWDAMQMDIEVTRTMQKSRATWGHIIVLGIAMCVMNIGLCLLLASMYMHFFCRDDIGEDADSNDDVQREQFVVSDGLAEAGMYKRLLPQEEEV